MPREEAGSWLTTSSACSRCPRSRRRVDARLRPFEKVDTNPMPCSAKLRPQDTPLDRARFVHEHLAPNLFRSVAGPETADVNTVAWRISPQPFPLAPSTVARLQAVGADLLALYRAVNRLYFMSVRGSAPEFIHRYLDLGKPEHIVRLE